MPFPLWDQLYPAVMTKHPIVLLYSLISQFHIYLELSSQLPIYQVTIDPWFQIYRELEDEGIYFQQKHIGENQWACDLASKPCTSKIAWWTPSLGFPNKNWSNKLPPVNQPMTLIDGITNSWASVLVSNLFLSLRLFFFDLTNQGGRIPPSKNHGFPP